MYGEICWMKFSFYWRAREISKKPRGWRRIHKKRGDVEEEYLKGEECGEEYLIKSRGG